MAQDPRDMVGINPTGFPRRSSGRRRRREALKAAAAEKIRTDVEEKK